MDVIYELVGGYIDIDKRSFVKDILLKKSDIRSLINNNIPGDIKPNIEKDSEKVKILFDDATDIDIGLEYMDFFKRLKGKFKGELKGRLAIRVNCDVTYSSVMSLDSEDGRVYVY